MNIDSLINIPRDYAGGIDGQRPLLRAACRVKRPVVRVSSCRPPVNGLKMAYDWPPGGFVLFKLPLPLTVLIYLFCRVRMIPAAPEFPVAARIPQTVHPATALSLSGTP